MLAVHVNIPNSHHKHDPAKFERVRLPIARSAQDRSKAGIKLL